MSASTPDATLPRRHSALAWSCAVAFSVALLAVRFDSGPVLFAASGFLAAAVATWIVRKWARAKPAEIPGVATARACAWLSVLAFWLWTIGWLIPLAGIYLVPASNRAYAESLGVDLTSLLAAALATAIAVSAFAMVSIRALNSSAPGSSPILRTACWVIPVTCLLLALSPVTYLPDWTTVWRERGADLPGPTLFYVETRAYWGILPAIALACSIAAWTNRSRAVVFARTVAVSLFLLLLCSALLTLAVAAAWLPLFGLCAAV